MWWVRVLTVGQLLLGCVAALPQGWAQDGGQGGGRSAWGRADERGGPPQMAPAPRQLSPGERAELRDQLRQQYQQPRAAHEGREQRQRR